MLTSKQAASLPAISGSADILLIQTNDPWEDDEHYVGNNWYDGVTSDTEVLDDLEYTYDIATWDDISEGLDIFGYPVVLIVNDQVQEFYDEYAARVAEFENYVSSGRTLVFFAASDGWAGGTLDANLPGGVQIATPWYEYHNYIATASHPIVSAELSDGVALTNSDLYSNYCSHGYFSSLPGSTTVILRESRGYPTLITYELGNGRVIASTQTWEHNWSYHTGADMYGSFARKALDDVFLYAFSGGITPSDDVEMSLHIEDAPEGAVVTKVAGDADGSAGTTYVDVVAKIVSRDSNITEDIAVTLKAPSAVLGDPETSVRVSSNDISRQSVGYESVGVGEYKVTTDLSMIGFLRYGKQIIWRFEVPDNPQELELQAELEVPGVSLTESEARAQLNIVDRANTIIIANRTLLYGEYADSEVNDLLRQMYTIAQGPPRNQSPLPVVYYVDRYSDDARDWDRSGLDHSDPEDTINEAADSVDDLIEDWYDDSTLYLSITLPVVGTVDVPIVTPLYLLIVGDDDTIPFLRKNDPTNTERKYSGPRYSMNETILDDAIAHDYFFTDAKYADIGDSGWEKGEIELAVGRIVGESPTDMVWLLQRGTSAPNVATNHAVIASRHTRDPIIPGEDNDAVDALRDERGFDILNDDEVPTTIQDDGWTQNNLTDAMDEGFGVFWFWGHGDHDRFLIPAGGHLDANEVDDVDDNDILTNNRPLWGFAACRIGFSYDIGWEHSLVYSLIHHGASGVIASPAIHNSDPDPEQVGWGEKLSNDFWQEAISGTGVSRPLGLALRDVKKDYNAGAIWNGKDKKAVMMYTLFGIPWMRIPGSGTALQSAQQATEAAEGRRSFQPVQLEATDVYSATAVVDASSYTIDTTTAPGFDLIQVSGLDLLKYDDRPILPGGVVELILPFGANILDILVTPTESTSLGTLNIPSYTAGDDIEGGEDGGYQQTPDTVGLYPEEPYEIDTTTQDGFQIVEITVLPVVYDATTDHATIHRSLSLEVTYEAPLEIAITDFSTDKASYAPSDTINLSATMENVSAADASLRAALAIKDEFGQTVASQNTGWFTVPSGGSHTEPLAWTGMLDEGSYEAVLTVSDGTQTLSGASASFSVLGGQITDFTAPDTVSDFAEFQVTFANYRTESVNVAENVHIYDDEGLEVAKLPQKTTTVGPASEAATYFSWDTSVVPDGSYSAIVVATADGVQYGPVITAFRVQRRKVYLPLVLRNSGTGAGYNWLDATAGGTIVADGDDTYQYVSLPFDFRFYGNTYDGLYVSSNGFVSFGSGYRTFSNDCIPSTSTPNNAIYAFWDDLKPDGGGNGNVYVKQTNSSTFVIEWHDVRKYGTTDYQTFEIVLHRDDSITLQYQSMTHTSSATVGVENATGTLAQQHICNGVGMPLTNQLAIQYTTP